MYEEFEFGYGDNPRVEIYALLERARELERMDVRDEDGYKTPFQLALEDAVTAIKKAYLIS